jgi:Tfp pilus assembly protein PilX
MIAMKMLTNERGIVLVISLLTIVLLIGAGAAAIVSTQIDLRTSGNLGSGSRTFYIAEAGVNHARSELQNRNGAMGFNQAMQASAGTIIASNSSFGGGAYRVTLLESATNPDRIRAVSRATAPNNSVSEVEAWFRKNSGRSRNAINAGGDLKISGSPKLIGACGGAHSNDDLLVTGNPAVQMADGLTSANVNVAVGVIPEGINIAGAPCVGSSACAGSQPPANSLIDSAQKRSLYEASHSNVDPHDVPAINPAEYAPHVAALGAVGNAYILHDDGTMTTGPGISCHPSGLCVGGNVVAVPQSWSFSAGTWKVDGVTAADGIFYFETKVEIAGAIGTAGMPWQATIIARDSIHISGDPYLRPYPTPSLPLQDHLLVTGHDLEISGNMTANYAPGAILVHQQLRISRNPQIAGFLIAEDGQSTWAGDPFVNSSVGVALSEISGDPTIDYACQFGCLGPGCPQPMVTVMGWKQKF